MGRMGQPLARHKPLKGKIFSQAGTRLSVALHHCLLHNNRSITRTRVTLVIVKLIKLS
jgi:hypothetical protein